MLDRMSTLSGSLWQGMHAACRSSSCAGDCCSFPADRTGYLIILQPGELDFARSCGASTQHLHVVDDNFHGGQKAVCAASNKRVCDFGWKPFDCRMHPIFPGVDENGEFTYKVDPHCAAHQSDVFGWHLGTVARELTAQFLRRPDLVDFYRLCGSDEDDYSAPQPFKELTYFMNKSAAQLMRCGYSACGAGLPIAPSCARFLSLPQVRVMVRR